MRITSVLNKRGTSPAKPPANDGPKPLTQLSVGEQGTVTGLAQGVDSLVARRLVDLGFGPGTQVEVVRRAPLGDPCIYRVCGYEIALRAAQSGLITVQPGA